MKTGTGSKVKLGVFIFIGIVLFFAGIYNVGKSKNMFDTTFRITGIFNNVGGLQVGNNVRFSGINVGTVDAITIISDTSVQVDVIIEAALQKFIKKDSKATIGSEGLMGNKVINITPGSAHAEAIEADGMIATIKPFDPDAVIEDVKTSIENIKGISADLGKIMGNIRKGRGTIGTLLVDTTFSRNIKETMVNLNKGTSSIEATMQSVKSGTDGFNGTVEAINNSFLLKGYFKKKDKLKEKEFNDKERLEAERRDSIEKNGKKIEKKKRKAQKALDKQLAKELKEKEKIENVETIEEKKIIEVP